jgi:uncharacterized membrane protein
MIARMTILLVGLILFLGIHSVRIVADGWRARVVASRGLMTWKGLYSVVAIAGFVLIVVGFGQARQQPVVLWTPPRWTHDLAGLLTLVAFVLLVAAYVPGNAIKARVHDPMVLGVKTWAFAHLMANGTLPDVVLFGSFLAWSMFDFRAVRRRRAAGLDPQPARAVTASRTAITVVVGLAAWILFAFHLHAWLIGVRPFDI